MSDAKSQQEPSMEEILASIRRIISEDGTEEKEPGAEGRAPEIEPEIEDVEQGAAADAPDVVDAPGAADPGDEDAVADVLELTDVVEDSEAEPQPDAGAEEEAAEMTSATDVPDEDAALVSPTTDAAAGAVFARLNEATTPEARPAPLPLGQGDRTLEEIVRELLRPMLREWLDANLPGLVEEIVDREVQRLSRDRRRR